MNRMTKMKPKIQRTSGSAVSTTPASVLSKKELKDKIRSSDPAAAFESILKKYQDEKGVGGQDMLPDPRRKIKPVMATSSPSRSMYSKYIRSRHPSIVPNKISAFRTSSADKVEGMPVIPKPESKQEFVPIDSSCDATEDSKRNAPPFQRIIDRIVREGKPKDVVKQAQKLFAKK